MFSFGIFNEYLSFQRHCVLSGTQVVRVICTLANLTWPCDPGRKRSFMPGFWCIRFVSVSATGMYRSRDRGRPCLAPLVSLISCEKIFVIGDGAVYICVKGMDSSEKFFSEVHLEHDLKSDPSWCICLLYHR